MQYWFQTNMTLIRWVAVGVLGIMLLSLLPISLVQLSGPAAAGLSSGFAQPLQHIGHIVLFFLLGIICSGLSLRVVVLLPATFLLMMAIGAMTDISLAQVIYGRAWLFALIMIFALCVSVAYSRAFLIICTVFSACAYYFGTRYMLDAPTVASSGFFLLGCLLSSSLIIACGISSGVALQGFSMTWRRLSVLLRVWLRRIPFFNMLAQWH